MDEYIRTNALVKRNNQMTKKSIEIMKKSPDLSNFFAFGAAHFRGPDNIAELLRKEGYRVLRVKVGDKVEPNVRSKATTWYSRPSPVDVIVFLVFTIMVLIVMTAMIVIILTLVMFCCRWLLSGCF